MSFDEIRARRYGEIKNRDEFDRLLRRNLTHAQWVDLVKKDIYLYTIFQTLGYSGVKPEEEKRVITILKQQSVDIWDLIYASCVAEAIEKMPHLSHEKRQKYAFSRAESLMLEEMYIPPHFTKFGKCKSCGPVYLPDHAIDLEPITCPWCVVPFLSRLNEIDINNKGVNYEQ